MRDILERVRAVNYMPTDIRDSLIDLRVDDSTLGKVRPQVADMLCKVGAGIFELAESGGKAFLTLTSSVGNSVDERSAAINRVMEQLRADGVIRGWRGEVYPIGVSFYEPHKFVVERAAVSWLGAIEYGVHVNGLVRTLSGETKMWIGRRAADKSKYPNMLDHIVAGGQPAGYSLMENVVKECMEEAGIPKDLALAGVRPAGAISYETYDPKKDTVTRAVLYNYDLYLSEDFVPQPVDGEVQNFMLWSVEQVLEAMSMDYADPIKPNCYSVIIDWLLREGYLSPEVPGYLDVLRELRSGDCR
jgi:isopentenyldiphosphate isomerase